MFDLSNLSCRDFVLQNQVLSVLLEEVRNECGSEMVTRILNRAETLLHALEVSEPDQQGRAVFADARTAVNRITVGASIGGTAKAEKRPPMLLEQLEQTRKDAARYQGQRKTPETRSFSDTINGMLSDIRRISRPRD